MRRRCRDPGQPSLSLGGRDHRLSFIIALRYEVLGVAFQTCGELREFIIELQALALGTISGKAISSLYDDLRKTVSSFHIPISGPRKPLDRVFLTTLPLFPFTCPGTPSCEFPERPPKRGDFLQTRLLMLNRSRQSLLERPELL